MNNCKVGLICIILTQNMKQEHRQSEAIPLSPMFSYACTQGQFKVTIMKFIYGFLLVSNNNYMLILHI